MTTREEATASGDRTIVVTRVFDAPREDVFRAWTDPELMAQWFAPEPLTVPKAEIDLRVGGRYTLVMRDPDGNEFTGSGEYLEVVAPGYLVYSDSLDEMPGEWVDMVNEARGEAKGTPVADGVATLTFEEFEGETTLVFTEEWDSKATRDAFVEMQMVEGLEMSFENLDKVLANMRK